MCQILIVSNYKLIRKIGEGGFGAVWLVQNLSDGSILALKEIFSPSKSGHERKALEQYAKLSTRGNPDKSAPIDGVIPILDVFEENDKLYYTMPLSDGTNPDAEPTDSDWQPLTLEWLIENRRTAPSWFSAKEIAAIMLPIFETVEKLNTQGLIHRDIKPANILFFKGKPCLADIGLMTVDRLSASSAGTPDFRSPSWYVNGNPDMWGCAATMFCLMTGNPPDLMGRGAYMWQPCGKDNMTFGNVVIWGSFNNIVNRATAEKPNDRYLRFSDLIADVRNVADGKKIINVEAKQSPQRRPLRAIIAGASISAAVLLSAVLLRMHFSGGEVADSAAVPAAQPKVSAEKSLNDMTRQELIERCNNLAVEIQNSSNDKKILTLFEKLVEASVKVTPCSIGAEVNVVPFVIADSKGMNPIPVMGKARYAAKRAGKTDIVAKIDRSLDIFEPHYYRNVLTKREKEKLVLNLVAKIGDKNSTPQEVVDAFDRITSINIGYLMSQRKGFSYSMMGSYLKGMGVVDIDSVFEKAEEAFAKLGDKKRVEAVKEGYFSYFASLRESEKKSKFGELYSKIENRKSTPREVQKAFERMVAGCCAGGNLNGWAYRFVDTVCQMLEKTDGFNADSFFERVEKSYLEIGDEQRAKEIQNLRKIYKEKTKAFV